MPKTEHPYFVEERLAHGSYCHLCPLNGQRKVGCDGPPDAAFIGIAEAPGKDEEQDGKGRGQKYGRPLVGKTGYLLKTQQLARPEVGLVETETRAGSKWPRVTKLHIFLMNVIMCRPPRNKITTKEGRAAVACCSDSARWLLRKMLTENPERTVVAMGATSLGLILRKPRVPIEPHRGRPRLQDWLAMLEPMGEAAVAKQVLRGKKPKEEWWPSLLWFLNAVLKLQRSGLRRAAKERARQGEEKLNKDGRWLIYAPQHHRANNGWVFRAIYNAERAFNTIIAAPQQVHHIDYDKTNDSPDNLLICEDQVQHGWVHRVTDALRACGDGQARKCELCHQYDREGDGGMTVVIRQLKAGPKEKCYHKCCRAFEMKQKRAKAKLKEAA